MYKKLKDEEKKDSRKYDKIEELPSEFECCFCTTKAYKDYRDPENLMPLATSDFRNPICQELRALRDSNAESSSYGYTQYSPNQDNYSNSYFKNNNESCSADSTDTFASCHTHFFHSQGDLTEEGDSNLYINPLESTEKCNGCNHQPSETNCKKKNTPTGVLLHISDTRSVEQTAQTFDHPNEDGRENLTDTILPKHKKTRIQQSGRQRTHFGMNPDTLSNVVGLATENPITGDNNNQYGLIGAQRNGVLTTADNFASPSRVINHHLFGNIAGLKHSYSGKSTGSKLSLSSNSIDSETTPFIDRHRVSKSILKKSDVSSIRGYNNDWDSDKEKLISENTSATSIYDSEGDTRDAVLIKVPVSKLSQSSEQRSTGSTSRTRNESKEGGSPDRVDPRTSVGSTAALSKSLFDALEEEKQTRDEAVTENRCKERDDDQPQGESEDYVKCDRPVAGKSSKQHSTLGRRTRGHENSEKTSGNRDRKKPASVKSKTNSNCNFRDYNRFSS